MSSLHQVKPVGGGPSHENLVRHYTRTSSSSPNTWDQLSHLNSQVPHSPSFSSSSFFFSLLNLASSNLDFDPFSWTIHLNQRWLFSWWFILLGGFICLCTISVILLSYSRLNRRFKKQTPLHPAPHPNPGPHPQDHHSHHFENPPPPSYWRLLPHGDLPIRFPIYSVQQHPTLDMDTCRTPPILNSVLHPLFHHEKTSKKLNFDSGKRIGHVSVFFEGKLVIWGGYNDEKFHRSFPTNEVCVYDPLIQRWMSFTCVKGGRDDLPLGTSGSTATLIGPFMYIFGGYTEEGNTNDLYRIDLRPLRWATPESIIKKTYTKYLKMEKIHVASPSQGQTLLPLACDKNVSWTYQDKMYVFGGYGYEQNYEGSNHFPSQFHFVHDTSSWSNRNRGWNNQLACFDPESCTWSFPQVAGNWPKARAAHAAAFTGDKVFLFGGRHDSRRLNDLWELDLRTMSWNEIKIKDCPTGRSWHSFTAISRKEILLYGGLSNSRTPLSDCWVFNTDHQRWIRVLVTAEPRLWHSAVFSHVDQQLFIYGGGTEDILNHNTHMISIYSNDLITIRFTPDSLVRLSLDAVMKNQKLTRPSWGDTPRLLHQVLRLRTYEPI